MPRALICPQCGGGLPPRALRAVVVCAYCHASVSLDGALVRASEFRAARDGLARASGKSGPFFMLAELPYRIVALVGRGESTDVYFAERAHPVSERVLLHVLRRAADEPLLRHAAAVLAELAESDAQGAPHFTRRLPQIVAVGTGSGAGLSGPTLAVRHASGFVDTLDDVRDAFPGGIDPRHAVWIWRRLLETLGFIHRSGRVHGAVLPQHVVLHAADHGALLVGWSASVREGERLEIASEADLSTYPSAMLDGAPLSPRHDLAMAARAIARLLAGRAGSDPPAATPLPIAALLERAIEPDTSLDDAWELSEQVSTAAAHAFGPPRFVPFSLPSWDAVRKGIG